MSSFYVVTHPSPQGAHAGWSYCAVTDCECSLPKVCLNSDCHCTRQKVCTRSECDCDRLKVCNSPFCECDRPKVITDSYGSPIKVLVPSMEEDYSLV
jgi:hypothetical protein